MEAFHGWEAYGKFKLMYHYNNLFHCNYKKFNQYNNYLIYRICNFHNNK